MNEILVETNIENFNDRIFEILGVGTVKLAGISYAGEIPPTVHFILPVDEFMLTKPA
jgi:hypothetical protein